MPATAETPTQKPYASRAPRRNRQYQWICQYLRYSKALKRDISPRLPNLPGGCVLVLASRSLDVAGPRGLLFRLLSFISIRRG